MNINFYFFNKRINSTLTPIAAEINPPLPILNLTGNFEAESSILMPTIIVANNNIANLEAYNYFSIEFSQNFKRYYFVRDMVIMPSGRFKVSGIEDIFGTYPDILDSPLHITSTNRLNMFKLAPIDRQMIVPTNYRRIIEKRIDLSSKFSLTQIDGTYIIAIAMPEYKKVGSTWVESPGREKASFNKSGIGYYVFSYEGAVAFLSKITDIQAENSDFNVKEKIISIMYVPLQFIDTASTVTDTLEFLIGYDANNVAQYLSIPKEVSSTVVYTVRSDMADGVADYSYNALGPTSSFILESDVKYYDNTLSTNYNQFNYEPYTSLELMLPYFGVMSVNISDLFNPIFEGHSANAGAYSCYNYLDAKYDVATGISTVQLRKVCYFTTSGGVIEQATFIIAEKTVQFGVNIPYYGYDSQGAIAKQLLEVNYKRNLVHNIVKTVQGIGTAGAGIAAAVGTGGIGAAVGAGAINQGIGSIANSITDFVANAKEYDLQQAAMDIEHGYVMGSNSGSILAASYPAYAVVRCIPVDYDNTTNVSQDLAFPLPCNISASISDLLNNTDYSFTGAFITASMIYLSYSYLTYDEQIMVNRLLTQGVFIE